MNLETHILKLDYLDAEVHVDDDGSVGVYLKPVYGQALKLDAPDLAAIVAFVEMHGQVTIGAPA